MSGALLLFNGIHCWWQELRKQLEDQVVLIETLRNESRAAVEHHEIV